MTGGRTGNGTRHRVVVVGGGFGGLNVTRALAEADGVEVTVLDRTNHHLFQPLLYQVAAGILPPGLIAPALQFNLAFRPGSRAEYSNTNYGLLGEIVQRITKKPLGRVLRERIFTPLGLRSTTYEPGARRLDPRQLHGYEVGGGASPRDVSWNTFGGLKPDGAIVSTARDLAVFFGALIRGKLATKPLLAKMMTIVPRSHGEGMGLYRLPSPCGRNYFGHTGGTPGYITFAAATRDGRRVVVVAINGVCTNAIEAMGHLVDDLLCR